MSADGGATLKLRSAGVIQRRGRVLLHRGHEDDFWTLPGGTIDAGERSDEALIREIDEEMRIAAHAVRLLWVAENRFTYVGRRYHEIGFYWLLDVPDDAWRSWPEHEGEFGMAEPHIIFRWAARGDLPAVTLKPDFLAQGLLDLPAGTVHLQIDEQ